jgi:hypothetical protein
MTIPSTATVDEKDDKIDSGLGRLDVRQVRGLERTVG